MPFPDIDPVIFHIWRFPVRWYGLMYIIGFIAGYFIIWSDAKRRKLDLSKDDVADLIFYLALGVILGGRLGYVLFYHFGYYLENPLKLFAINEGGMSFHGGLVGITIAALLFARKKKMGFFQLADLCAPAAPVGLGLGRVGNFINGELYGRQTDMPWGIIFPGGGNVPRHPSQLYEAFLEGLVLFAILWIIRRRRPPVGVVFWSFIAFYGLFRFIVEFFREPDQHLGFFFGGISMGQVLSFPMLVVGAIMVLLALRKGART